MVEKKKDFAPGIYDPSRFEPIPTVRKRERWDSVIHEHRAFRAGIHYDLRIIEPETDNAHSWALRKLPLPGQKVLAVQQPTHSVEYAKFKGVIPRGYGAGTVKIYSKKKITVRNADPEKITFERGKELFTLVKTKPKKGRDRDWLLLNRTKTASVGLPSNEILSLVFAGLLKGTTIGRAVKEG